MEYKLIGRTGVRVSSLCFGTMSFGGDADKATSQALFHRCREAGINFFDCANVYQAGAAEEILGELVGPCRDEIVLTSKVYFSMGKDINAGGASRRHITAAVEASLKRLRTDRLDFYFIHHFFANQNNSRQHDRSQNDGDDESDAGLLFQIVFLFSHARYFIVLAG